MEPKDPTVDAVTFSVVSTNDSQTIPYPTGRTAASYGTNGDHKVTGRDFSELSSRLGHITVTFGPSDITIVNNTDRTFKAGTVMNIALDLAGYDRTEDEPNTGVVNLFPVQITLGTPIASDGDGYCVSQNLTAAGVFSVDVTAAAAIAAAALAGTADVPRNVVAAWTGTAVLTVTGTDVDGNVMVESSGSGTSFTGKKAFKTVTDISVSANVTGLTVGTSKVLGLPVFVESAVDLLGEKENGALATAGTLVVGATATATATTGDVRGTYAPNSAPDGSKLFQIVALVKSKSYKGIAQFSG